MFQFEFYEMIDEREEALFHGGNNKTEEGQHYEAETSARNCGREDGDTIHTMVEDLPLYIKATVISCFEMLNSKFDRLFTEIENIKKMIKRTKNLIEWKVWRKEEGG